MVEGELEFQQTVLPEDPAERVRAVLERIVEELGLDASVSVEESEALLDAVWAHATQERFAWYQKWRGGDLVLWDNRCVMHRRDAFDESLRRLMHRTQIVGEPVLAG